MNWYGMVDSVVNAAIYHYYQLTYQLTKIVRPSSTSALVSLLIELLLVAAGRSSIAPTLRRVLLLPLLLAHRHPSSSNSSSTSSTSTTSTAPSRLRWDI